MDTKTGTRKGKTKKFLMAGTGFDHEHLSHVASPIPLPSMRLATRSRKAFTRLSEGLFSWPLGLHVPASHVPASGERSFIDRIFPVDLASDRICNGNHPLVVFENPADFASL